MGSIGKKTRNRSIKNLIFPSIKKRKRRNRIPKIEIIYLPRRLTFETTIDFCNRLKKTRKAKEYILDFGRTGIFEPFALVFLSGEILLWRNRNPGRRFSIRNHSRQGYAAHMGFFQAFGCKYGNNPGQAKGSNTYIPLTILTREYIQREASSRYEEPGQIIEEEAQKMSKILTRSTNGDLYDALTYSIREIIRNVIEHSEANELRFCAQYWPTKNKVELALIDRGVGIREGLSRNPNITINNDKDALNYCLMPGISGKSFKGSRKPKYSPWINSGYGLYMTSRLCREGGSFFIASGEAGIYLSEEKRKYLNTPFKGTILRLSIHTNRIHSLNEMLQQYDKEARQFKEKYIDGQNLSASTASKMLSRDFKNIANNEA